MNDADEDQGSIAETTSRLERMIADGAIRFTEAGPGKVLQGLIMKIDRNMTVDGVS